MKLELNLLRALALMQNQGEDFFILVDDSDQDNELYYAFEGNEDDAREDFEADIEGTDEANIDANFLIYCQNNLTEVEELDPDDYNNDYLVLTDEEADEKAAEYIKDSLWAFNASFIIDHSKLPYDAIDMIKNYQDTQCERANETIEALIEDMDEFISDAISADGRGHFMSTYDGNEYEETIEGETFYIYRIN